MQRAEKPFSPAINEAIKKALPYFPDLKEECHDEEALERMSEMGKDRLEALMQSGADRASPEVKALKGLLLTIASSYALETLVDKHLAKRSRCADIQRFVMEYQLSDEFTDELLATFDLDEGVNIGYSIRALKKVALKYSDKVR